MKIWMLAAVIVFSLRAEANDFFSSSDRIDIQLSYDISELRKSKETLRDVGLPAKLEVGDIVLDVSVAPRGAGSFHCDQPQLQIDFKEPTHTVFQGLKKLKHFVSGRCADPVTNQLQDQLVLSNYLLYKLQDELFTLTYRARLLKIKFVDTSGATKDYEQLAFLLESKSMVEQRTKSKKLSQGELQKLGNELKKIVDSDSNSMMNTFQFFIANADYGVPGFFSPIAGTESTFQKNVHLYRLEDKAFPLSFDFDFSRFLFVGPYCAFTQQFDVFHGGQRASSCSKADLTEMLERELKTFHFADDVRKNLPLLLAGIERWRAKHAAEFASLGEDYNKNLSIYIEAFKEVASK